jgi:hypothetical protein
MAKYGSRQSQNSNRPSKLNPKVHPIWRGVGFVLMVLSPIMAYATMELFMIENAAKHLIMIPNQLIVAWQDPYVLVKVIGTLFLTLIYLVAFQLVYFIIMRIFAPPRYGPLDVPPITYKGKQYKR